MSYSCISGNDPKSSIKLHQMPQLQNLISELSLLSPRQGENETATAQLIEYFLNKSNLSYQVQLFATQVPVIKSAELFLDGQSVPCLGSCFNGGQITSKSQVNISPHSDYIETITYTSTPGVCISRTNKELLSKATNITGKVSLEKYSFRSRNFLVGNRQNPKKIIFAHYDSLGGGAIDNSGGVACCLDLIATNSRLLNNNLFVFAGNEELSYDKKEYWGKGYRDFEKQNIGLLIPAEEIIVVDGVGLTSPVIIGKDLDNFFPVKYLKQLFQKLTIYSSLQTEVLKYYHCAEDTPDKLNMDFLREVQTLLQQKLQNK